MRTTTLTAAIVAAGIGLAGCSGSSNQPTDVLGMTASPAATLASEAPLPDSRLATDPQTAACWRAIRDQYAPGTVQLTGAPAQPAACEALSADLVSQIAADVLEHQLGG